MSEQQLITPIMSNTQVPPVVVVRSGLKDSSRISMINSKQKRIEKQQSITRQRRAKLLAKRRKIQTDTNRSNNQDQKQEEQMLKVLVFGPESSSFLQNLVSELDHEKYAVRIKALKTLRTVLSLSVDSTSIQISSDSNCAYLEEEQQNNSDYYDDEQLRKQEDVITTCLGLPKFLPLLQKHLCCANNVSQLEAAWCITNIASSTHEHTQAILPCSLQLIAYLYNADPVVQEQCAWALGNIAGDSSEYAQLLIRNGILKPLCNLLGLKIPDLIKTVVWCLSNIIRGVATQEGMANNANAYDMSIFFQKEHNFAPLLIKMLQSENEGVAIECAWALSYLSFHPDYNLVLSLLQQNLLPPVISLLCKNENHDILRNRIGITIPVLRILGTIARGPDQIIESILTCADTPKLLNALMIQMTCSDTSSVQKETIWALSNLASGTPVCVDILARAGFVPILLQFCVSTNSEDQFEIKREALYALVNICSDTRLMDLRIIEYMMQGIDHILSRIVQEDRHDVSNEELAIVCLNFISFVLQVTVTRIEHEKQAQVKQLVPFPIVKQFQQRYTNHQGYQQASRTILQFVESH